MNVQGSEEACQLKLQFRDTKETEEERPKTDVKAQDLSLDLFDTLV